MANKFQQELYRIGTELYEQRDNISAALTFGLGFIGLLTIFAQLDIGPLKQLIDQPQPPSPDLDPITHHPTCVDLTQSPDHLDFLIQTAPKDTSTPFAQLSGRAPFEYQMDESIDYVSITVNPEVAEASIEGTYRKLETGCPDTLTAQIISGAADIHIRPVNP